MGARLKSGCRRSRTRNVYYDITNVYDFAECFDISIEIAEAIFEVASTHRPAKIIWADPTPDETKTIVSRAWQLADANELALCWNSKPLWRQDLKHVFACAPNGDDYDVYDVGWASTAEDAARLVMRAKFKVITPGSGECLSSMMLTTLRASSATRMMDTAPSAFQAEDTGAELLIAEQAAAG